MHLIYSEEKKVKFKKVADTIDALIIDGGSSGESAARFRIHVVLADISSNPTETATVSTGT